LQTTAGCWYHLIGEISAAESWYTQGDRGQTSKPDKIIQLVVPVPQEKESAQLITGQGDRIPAAPGSLSKKSMRNNIAVSVRGYVVLVPVSAANKKTRGIISILSLVLFYVSAKRKMFLFSLKSVP
jgi:hypothetical protein